jgi:hypothetical protein
MITASLLINILVLIPVCSGLILKVSRFDFVFGIDSTARQILSSIYLAILLMSLVILLFPGKTSEFLIPLLSIQVFYKLSSVMLIKNKKTPVLWFNLVIAIFHSITIFYIFSDHH